MKLKPAFIYRLLHQLLHTIFNIFLYRLVISLSNFYIGLISQFYFCSTFRKAFYNYSCSWRNYSISFFAFFIIGTAIIIVIQWFRLLLLSAYWEVPLLFSPAFTLSNWLLILPPFFGLLYNMDLMLLIYPDNSLPAFCIFYFAVVLPRPNK